MKTHRVLATVLAFALLNVATTFAQQTAEELYQAGLYQEEVQGDLEHAIDIYRHILDDYSGNRTIGARAQLHIGLCYEKLGQQEAQQAYRRVIDDFPEHADEVAVARARLARIERSLAELNHEPSFRKIEIASQPQDGILSPDGDQLAFVSDGSLWVVPLHGPVDPEIAGEPVRIAEAGGIWENGSVGSWSANGEWIAVNSATGEEDDSVYVIPVAGGEPRVVPMPDRGSNLWSYRVSLSPDGQNLAFSARELGVREVEPESSNRVIYSIPVAGGEPTRISSGWGRFPSFSPDGRWIAYVGFRERDDWRENTERARYDGDLWVASSSGGNAVRVATIDGRLRGPVWSPDGKYIAAHLEPGRDSYSDEIWVFPFSSDGPSAAEPIKIPLPRESGDIVSGWTPDGELGVFIEAEQHQAVYTVPASGGKAVQVSGEGYAWYPRWSSDGKRIYLRALWDTAPTTVGYIPSAGGSIAELSVEVERRLVGRVPGGGFNVSPDGERILMSAYQEPWDSQEGLDLWTIPLDGGPPTRLTNGGAFEGYPCWSPDGTWVAFIDFSGPEGEDFSAIYTVPAGGGEVQQLTAQSDSVDFGPIAISPDGQRIAFLSNGAIKTIPAAGGAPEVLMPGVQAGWRSDLAWSPDGTKIAYDGGGAIWIAPADGGDPQELRTGLPDEAWQGSFSWSPDGQKIAFIAVMGGEDEFYLISDFLPTNEDR